MPVELNITESVTELDTTIVTVTLESASEPGPAGPGVPTGGTAGQVLTKDSGTDYDTSWQDATGGGGGGVTDADYLVGTAHAGLSAEIVVGTSPGGELGGTWASPTVDTTHSGSSHAAVQAAAEATAAAALTAHEADTTGVHGIADTSALALTANHPSNATFNDHSARHENGGADEISIAGLDGTSTELAAHLADTSAAHAASAISVSSTSLSGTGTDVQAVFEEIDNLLDDHSARHENGGADEISIAGLDGTPTELTNHLNDTSDAHDASAISVADAAGLLTATDVEAALLEILNHGRVLDYVEITSNVTTTQTVEASATTAITSNSITFDGSTTVMLEFHAPGYLTQSLQTIIVNFWDGSTNLGQAFFAGTNGGTMFGPAVGRLRVTPSNGSHTFTVRIWGSSGTQTLYAGAGGAGAVVPAYLRIVRV